MPSPSLTKLGQRQQPVDKSILRVRAVVVSEMEQLFLCRRQANEIEKDTSGEREAIRIVRRRQFILFDLLQDKGVDRV